MINRNFITNLGRFTDCECLENAKIDVHRFRLRCMYNFPMYATLEVIHLLSLMPFSFNQKSCCLNG